MCCQQQPGCGLWLRFHCSFIGRRCTLCPAQQAHIQAAEALSLTSPLAGQAYFVTNNEDRTFWGFMGDLCEGLGYGRPRIR